MEFSDIDLEYFKCIEEIEEEEEVEANVIYHFGTTLEIQRESEVDWEEIEIIYDNYKLWKFQKQQVQFLKMIRQPEQRTKEWYDMRNGMITASDIATIIGDNPYDNVKKIFNKKAFFVKDEFTGNFATEWGVKFEPIACRMYELKTNSHINNFGLIPHYSNFQHQEQYLQPITFLGASPDGIRDDGVMLEIKCPTSREITGIPPRYYWVQMQIQMECCNLDRCHFLECKFIEFSNKEDFFSSSSNDKGVVSYNQTTKVYNYLFPVPDKREDIEAWCIQYEDTKISYFILDKYSCVLVERDRDWFASILPKLRKFWKEVLDARKNPEKYKEKDATDKKPKKTTKKKESCKIQFDQFEQLEKTIDLTDEMIEDIQKSTYVGESEEPKKNECLLDLD
jgi:putative phage-type endonuclease